MFAGDYEKSFEAANNFEQTSYIISEQGAALLRLGRRGEALEYLNRSIEMDPNGLSALWATGMKAYIEGDTCEGLDATRKIEEANIIDAEAWYHFSGNYGLLGDKDGCIRSLRRAIDGGFFNYPFMLNDFCFDSVRDSDEFQELLQQAKQKHLIFQRRYF